MKKMDIVKSQEWQMLANLPLSTLRTALNILSEETYNHEQGVGRYPKVEYAIGLAMDRIREGSIPLDAFGTDQPQPKVEKVEKVEEEDEEPWRKDTKEQRRERLRKMWEKKLQKVDDVKKEIKTRKEAPRRGRLAARRAKKSQARDGEL